MSIFSILAGPVFLTISAQADDNQRANVFNADTSHPDLELAISAFEQVCMPFVLHETEMDREHDKLHMTKLMQSRGFAFRSSAQETKSVVVEPKREPWKPASDDRERFKHIYAHNEKQNGKPKTTRGQFTIFNGISTEVISSFEAIKPPQNGEIWGPVQIPAKYKHFLIETEIYGDLNNPRLTAQIKWNFASQKDPGEQCEISLSQTTIPRRDFTTAFIAKDTDWKASADTRTTEPVSWSQCGEDGEDDFEFKVSHDENAIKMSMKRSDFFEPELCNESTHAQ